MVLSRRGLGFLAASRFWKKPTVLHAILLLSCTVDTYFLSSVFGIEPMRKGIGEHGSAAAYLGDFVQTPLIQKVTGLNYIPPTAVEAALFGSADGQVQLARLARGWVMEHRWPKKAVIFLLFPGFANNFFNLWWCLTGLNRVKGNKVPNLRSLGKLFQDAACWLVVDSLRQCGIEFDHWCHPKLWLAVFAALFSVDWARAAWESCGMPPGWFPDGPLVEAVEHFFSSFVDEELAYSIRDLLDDFPMVTRDRKETEELLDAALPIGRTFYLQLEHHVSKAGYRDLVDRVKVTEFFKGWKLMPGTSSVQESREAAYQIVAKEEVAGVTGTDDAFCAEAARLFGILKPEGTELTAEQQAEREQRFDVMMEQDAVALVEEEDAPYACSEPGCGKRFGRKGDLTRHQRDVHSGERPYACSFPGCGMWFGQKSHLTTHQRTVHSGERPYACSFPGCGMWFGQKSHLTRHQRDVHSGERPYACSFPGCGMWFGQKNNLTTHQRTVHLLEKPHACSDCGAQFARKSHLNDHQRAVHNGELLNQRHAAEEEPGWGAPPPAKRGRGRPRKADGSPPAAPAAEEVAATAAEELQGLYRQQLQRQVSPAAEEGAARQPAPAPQPSAVEVAPSREQQRQQQQLHAGAQPHPVAIRMFHLAAQQGQGSAAPVSPPAPGGPAGAGRPPLVDRLIDAFYNDPGAARAGITWTMLVSHSRQWRAEGGLDEERDTRARLLHMALDHKRYANVVEALNYFAGAPIPAPLANQPGLFVQRE